MEKVNRRQFFKVAGGAGATALLAYLPVRSPTGAEQGSSAAQQPPRRLRRWVMVIDLRRCDGCVSADQPPQCTSACILGRMVPTGMEWIQVFEYELPGGGTQFVPVPCQQCTNAPCVNVCPIGATFATPEGIVLIDQDRCIGCRLCMAACPYQRRFFNWGEPEIPERALFSEYNVETQIPARRGTVMKCDFCGEAPRQGYLPYCVNACPNGGLYYGDQEEDIATNGREVVKLSRFLSQNKAYRLKEDFGTKPSVYYIPGRGEDVGRDAFDPRKPKPVAWPWDSRNRSAQQQAQGKEESRER
ncbi:MAG: 4Fe-4S dicluster domain-containing protein [Chloroflexi bacterium]|nr:4Fe-4S dicluster domain-containing protein [Chloroflexota bacterium]